MELFIELQSQMEQKDLESFQQFILAKQRLNNQLLHDEFRLENGTQLTILNYLILHHEEQNNLVPHMTWLIKQAPDLDLAEPLHFAFDLKKTELISFLLNQLNQLIAQIEPLFTESYIPEAPSHLTTRELLYSGPITSDEDSEASSGVDSELESAEIELADTQIDGSTPLFHLPVKRKHNTHIDALNSQGRLIHRAIDLRIERILESMLSLSPNLNLSTNNMHPLQFAVTINFARAIPHLIKHGARMDKLYGDKGETVFHLAARHGAIDAMAALLEKITIIPGTVNPLDANIPGDIQAIDLLCERLSKKKEPAEALRGIAMLLCHGASTPRNEKWKNLLQERRRDLIAAVADYKAIQPDLCAQFYRAAHNRNGALHDIIYADQTVGTALRQLFGLWSKTAFKLEKLVSRPRVNEEPSSTNPFTQDEQWFARFMAYYKADLKSAPYNPYSTMLWRSTRGSYTNKIQVEEYCINHPNSRSALLRNEMLQVDNFINRYKAALPNANSWLTDPFLVEMAALKVIKWQDIEQYCRLNPTSHAAQVLNPERAEGSYAL